MALTDDLFTGDPETVTATFTFQDLTTAAVPGVFRDASDAVQSFGMEIEAVQPTFECETADIAAVKRGNAVQVNSANYTIERIARTGVGLSVVYLKLSA